MNAKNLRKKRNDAKWRDRIAAQVAALLRHGERAIPHACSDVALCGCEHHQHVGIPCTMLGRDAAAGHDRCLVCGAVWTSRDYRWQPATFVTAEAA